jgi:glyoxylase-like metal-dependent hydrolase (beta-lactamase superfamily II)
VRRLTTGVLAFFMLVGSMTSKAAEQPLAYDVYTAGPKGYGVTSTIIYGQTEALLVDAQFNYDDANRLADQIDGLGRRLTSIFITHPDPDHFVGLGVLQRRFPNATIFMTEKARSIYSLHAKELAEQFAKHGRAQETPALEPYGKPLSGSRLIVDGEVLQVLSNLQGDVAEAPANSAIWVPSLRLLVSGDLAFNKVHVWLDKSSPDGRSAWISELKKLDGMQPRAVVAGHKADAAEADTPSVLKATQNYIRAFDAEMRAHHDAPSVEAAMLQQFPNYGFPLFLKIASVSAKRD